MTSFRGDAPRGAGGEQQRYRESESRGTMTMTTRTMSSCVIRFKVIGRRRSDKRACCERGASETNARAIAA